MIEFDTNHTDGTCHVFSLSGRVQLQRAKNFTLLAHAAAHSTMSLAVGHPATSGASGFPVEARAHATDSVLVDRDGRGAAGPDGVLCMAKTPRSPRRTVAGLYGGTQRTPTAHGRTALSGFSIIGSADAGHIVYEGAMPRSSPLAGESPPPAILGMHIIESAIFGLRKS